MKCTLIVLNCCKCNFPHTVKYCVSGMNTSSYLEQLLEYLCGYLERTQPLLDQQSAVAGTRRDFQEKWATSTFPGWRVSGGAEGEWGAEDEWGAEGEWGGGG